MSHAASPTIDDLGQTENSRRMFGFSPGKFAMWLFLASDAMGFVGLISTYVVLRAANAGAAWVPSTGDYGWVHDGGPQQGLSHLDPILTGVATFVLILSSFFMVTALDRIRRGDQKGLKLWLGLVILGGVAFLGIQFEEYTHLMSIGVKMGAHPYAFTFFVCTGFHGAHVLAGVVYLTCVWVQAARGRYSATNHSPVELVGLFWHFVDLIWIILFTIIYLF
jgi:heme/copper-type cytochrome/quinol oxidase subunit 3